MLPVEHILLLSGLIFSLGFLGVLRRRTLLMTLVCIEIMLNAAAFAFVCIGSILGQADGQIMFLFILAVAAAEVAIGLALVMLYDKHFRTLDIDKAAELKG